MKKTVDNFITYGGKHCVTNSLKQVLNFYKLDISEEMLFGLGSGLGFVYINLANAPMISGRIKTGEFEEKIANRLNIKMKYKSSKNYSQVFEKTKQMLDRNEPVLIFTDMPYLKYLNLNEDSHFGGHAIVIFGYDDEKKLYLVSDRDNSDYPMRTPKGEISEDFHLVEYSEMEIARSSNHKPFPANNKYLEIDLSAYTPVSHGAIIEAIHETSSYMLNSQAGLLGINGINKFSKEVLKWKKFEPSKLRKTGITNFSMISADGGTGGGLFRKMYGEFLIEASSITKCSPYIEIGNHFIEIASEWDLIADLLWELSETGDSDILLRISQKAGEICFKEKEQYMLLNEIPSELS